MSDVLVGIALVVTGVALGAFSADLYSESVGTRLLGVVRILIVAAGVAIATGAVPLANQVTEASLDWRTDIESALEEARAAGKPAILDASAEWCGACKELERKTFSHADVVEALASFVKIRVDMTRFDEAQARLEGLGIHVPSLPWVGFFLPDGRLNPGVTLTDFEPPSLFLNRLGHVGTYREAPLTTIEIWLGEHGLFVAILLVFLAGVGVCLTPCVYPTIPATIAVVGGGQDIATLGQRALRSTAFVIGLFITYVSLGVTSALLGKGFGSWLQHPAVTIGMAMLFTAMAASYLGFFSIDLPASLKTRIARGRRGLLGVAVVGVGTGLLAAPCAGPVVVGILAMIGTSADVVLGVILMAAFASGMALFFFLLGLSTALLARLKRSGAGTSKVEIALAIGLLVVAAYYARLGITALLGS